MPASRKMSGSEMTGIELRARRRRLPGHRNADEPRSQPELAADIGYNQNTLAMLERGDSPLEKRGRVLHLALCTLEREAGLTEWHDLPVEERRALTSETKKELAASARIYGGGTQQQRKKAATKTTRKKK